MQERRLKWIIFSVVTFITWLLYFKTTAPTVVFWDVGEFLACSVIFGVPHPPGTPLYVVLGRFMTIFPLPLAPLYTLLSGGQPVNTVLKITSVSMLTGAFTAGFVYLIIFELLSLWSKDFPKIFAHIAGILGAFLGAFARTVWMNSIEAETYTPSIFVIVFLSWIALKWWKEKDDPKSIRYLLFSAYILALSSGIHLTPLAFFPALFIFVWLVKPDLLWDINFVGVTGIALVMLLTLKIAYEPGTVSYIVLFVGIGLMLYYLVKRGKFSDSSVGLEVGLAITLLAMLIGLFSKSLFLSLGGLLFASVFFYLKGELYKDWKGIALILMIIGFSLELVLILRAIHNPVINEADPSNFKAFMDVLTRKQYGPTKFFPRKIPFIDQFKLYWLYFSWQYKALLIPVTVLGLFGLLTHFSNDRKSFALVGGAFLILSIGFIFYLNLKDSPTHPVNPINPREVRDRDYFFAGAYTFFALYAAIGFWEVLRLLYENIKKKVAIPAVIGIPLALVMIVSQIAAFYPQVDRSRNYIAEDYGYNMLLSPGQEKCVLYTNGDNDTFPLWADQEVLGYGKNVLIANMSLLNTNWYIKQLKFLGAPISFSVEEIDNLPPVFRTPHGYIFLNDIMVRDMIATSSGYKVEKYVVIRPDEMFPGLFKRGKEIKIPAVYFASQKEFAEKVIAKADSFKMPIFFALTVSPEHYKDWNSFMRMEGLAYRVLSKVSRIPGLNEGIDIGKTRFLLHDDVSATEYIEKFSNVIPPTQSFRYRGIFDKRVFKDETHEKLIRNYAAIAYRLGFIMENMGALQDALEEWLFARALLDNITQKGKTIMQQKMFTLVKIADLQYQLGLFDDVIKTCKKGLEEAQVSLFYTYMGKALLAKGDTIGAVSYLEMAREMEPRDFDNYKYLVTIYLKKGEIEKAKRLLKEVLRRDSANVWAKEELKKIK